MTSHYQVLGLTNAATPPEIRRAFRILARRYHPDVNPGEASEEKFKRIARAHAVLSDPEKRKAYDLELEREAETFSQTFDRAHDILRKNQRAAAYKRATSSHQSPPTTEAPPPPPQARQIKRAAKATGADLRQIALTSRAVLLSLKDSIFSRSAKRKSAAKRATSRISLVELSIPMLDAIQGVRRSVEINGDDNKPRKISVRVPPGVRTGSIIRFRRKEDPSEEVVVIIQVEHHPWLSLSPRGLTMEIPLSISEALQGGKIQVPSLGEPLLVTVEPNTQAGREVRLKQQGVIHRDGSKGDLFIRFIVKIPSGKPTLDDAPTGVEYDKLYSSSVRAHLPKSIFEA